MAINVDQDAAARRESAGIHPELIWKGDTYELPVELPIDCVRALGRLSRASKSKDGEKIQDGLVAVMENLLTDEDFKRFMRGRPSISDISAVVAGIPEEYGIQAGESTASPKSSRTTSARPKPASDQPTE